MGLMDKVKAQAAQLAQQAQDTARDAKARMDQSQVGKRSDAMLRDLGTLVFADRTGRGAADSQAQIDKLIADLSGYESQNGVDLTKRSDQGLQGFLNSPMMSGPADTGPGEFLPSGGEQPPATFTDPGLAPPVPPGAPPAAPAAPVFPGTGSTAFPGQVSTSFPDAAAPAASPGPDPGTGAAFPDPSPGTSFPAPGPAAAFPDPSPGVSLPDAGPGTSFPSATSFPGTGTPPAFPDATTAPEDAPPSFPDAGQQG